MNDEGDVEEGGREMVGKRREWREPETGKDIKTRGPALAAVTTEFVIVSHQTRPTFFAR